MLYWYDCSFFIYIPANARGVQKAQTQTGDHRQRHSSSTTTCCLVVVVVVGVFCDGAARGTSNVGMVFMVSRQSLSMLPLLFERVTKRVGVVMVPWALHMMNCG